MTVILIDLDGTLVDSLPVLYGLYTKFMKQFGCVGTREEFAELNGPSLPEVVAILKERHGLQGDVRELSNQYLHATREHYRKELRLFPGALNFLDRMQASGYRLAVVTSADRETAEMILKREEIFDRFEAVVTGDQITKSKPDPEIYKLALSTMKISPSDAIAIEDAPAGVEAAKGAGIRCIWLTHHLFKGMKKHSPKGLEVHCTEWSQITRELIDGAAV